MNETPLTTNDDRERVVEIGAGVTIAYAMHEGAIVGIEWEHPTHGGTPCRGGWVPFKSYDPIGGWTVEQSDPLTLSPSLLCRACGCHGFIRSGRWVPC